LPFTVNGVPLRRVNQAYVIATSTKVDLESFSVDTEKFNDAYFSKDSKASRAGKETEFFGENKEKKTLCVSLSFPAFPSRLFLLAFSFHRLCTSS
jgi:ribosomal protein L14E/L6E/L27E